jgi:hypothetical protein
VELPIENGDFPLFCKRLPEGSFCMFLQFLEKQNEYVNMSTQMREMEQVAATQPEIWR